MSGTYTFTIIKPDAVQKKYQGLIIDKILKAGFSIKAMKLMRLNKLQAEKFYAIHCGKPFYESLVEFMISGEIIVMMLEKENAVADYRKFIGATNPAQAEENTIRKLYADSVQCNAVHGSDSDENALNEISFFFSDLEKL